MAIASSAARSTFEIKTSRLPGVVAAFPGDCRVFGDDAAMRGRGKKPMPDVFLVALGRVNAGLGVGEAEVRPGECLVFEDSVAGVEAGRRAGMRVCWVPHQGLRGVWRGREGWVLEGRTGEVDVDVGFDEEREDGRAEDENHLWSRDGWAEMRMSLEDFDYDHYGIRLTCE